MAGSGNFTFFTNYYHGCPIFQIKKKIHLRKFLFHFRRSGPMLPTSLTRNLALMKVKFTVLQSSKIHIIFRSPFLENAEGLLTS